MNTKTYFLLIFAAILVSMTLLNFIYLKLSIQVIQANRKSQTAFNNDTAVSLSMNEEAITDTNVISLRKADDQQNENKENLMNIDSISKDINLGNNGEATNVELKHHKHKDHSTDKHKDTPQASSHHDKNVTHTNPDIDSSVPSKEDNKQSPTPAENIPKNNNEDSNSKEANKSDSHETKDKAAVTHPISDPINPIIPPITPSDVPKNSESDSWNDDDFHKKDNEYHNNQNNQNNQNGHPFHNPINDQDPMMNGPSDNPLSKVNILLTNKSLNETSDFNSTLSVVPTASKYQEEMMKQGNIIQEINSGNVKIITFMMTSLCLIALGLALYEIYFIRKNSAKEKEDMINFNNFHNIDNLNNLNCYTLLDQEDINNKGIRDI